MPPLSPLPPRPVCRALSLALAPALPAQTPAPAAAAAPHNPARTLPAPSPPTSRSSPRTYRRPGHRHHARVRRPARRRVRLLPRQEPPPTPTGHLDFASDDQPHEGSRPHHDPYEPRNQPALPHPTHDPSRGPQVTCGTCHRGNAKPPAFVPPQTTITPTRPTSQP